MLQGLWAPDNQQQHSRALEYLQRLRESSDGWQICGATLTSGGTSLDDKVKFVCLQVSMCVCVCLCVCLFFYERVEVHVRICQCACEVISSIG